MKITIVGIGNKLKADDGFGFEVLKKLKQKVDDNILLINAGDVPENFLEEIVNFNPDKIFIVDTVEFQGKIGEIKFFDTDEIDFKSFSTHKNSLFVDYLKKSLKCKIKLIGIKPKITEFGKPMSKEIREGIDKAVKIILNQINY
jgi:hydrogenase maturation protease HycI